MKDVDTGGCERLTRFGLIGAGTSLRRIATLGEEELAGGAGLTGSVRAARACQRAQIVFAFSPSEMLSNYSFDGHFALKTMSSLPVT